MKAITTQCFKAYDIRGQVPEALNEDIAYRIGRALVDQFNALHVVVGRDMRLESPILSAALIKGITDAGADVIDIGLCGTEEVYFATVYYKTHAGVMVTASHNPKGHNGMKIVREGSVPISGDTGLDAIRRRVEEGVFKSCNTSPGQIQFKTDKSAYIKHILSYVDIANLKPLKILADPGNGMAGPIIEALKPYLPFEWVTLNAKPDGHFPNGVPNPLIPENRHLTQAALREHGCDMGIAWDGDFDRCFFYDADARFIEGYYLVGLLAEMLLNKHPGEKIIHDPRLTWNTIDQVTQAGGIAIQCKTGHAFIKERMRSENAIYGGEMSAHHYFRNFAYCDSGMIPWLLISALISDTGKTLAALVDDRIRAYPCSGEINFKVKDVKSVLAACLEHYSPEALDIDYTDGLSMSFATWRFNVRGSNTEPLLRLNIETRGDSADLELKVAEFVEWLNSGIAV